MKYAKLLAAVIATILSAIVAATAGDGFVDAQEWVNVAILAVGSAGVFAAPNVPHSQYTKVIIAVLSAALTVLSTAILGGIDSTEIMQMVLAGLAAVGVYAVPNTPDTGRHVAV